MANQPKQIYGGQAVIEGVMIRGRDNFGLAVRREDGSIELHQEALSSLYNGRPRRWPLLRGFLTLVETMVLGIKALQLSANMAAVDRSEDDEEEGIPGWVMASTLGISLVFGIGLFFITPLVIAWLLNPVLNSDLLSEIVEGVIRLVFLLAYISAISMLKDVKRVFAYHGAEHMTVHAYEADLPLTVENVRKFGTPHPRCGTAFLLTVVVVSVVVFALLLGPPLEWRIASRILLLPVIAAVSYEFIRFSGLHADSWFGKMVAKPGLWLQKLTTRQPDDSQIEVAIHAMQTAIAADRGETVPRRIPASVATIAVKADSPPETNVAPGDAA
ncbi:MAG: DUF1385 domain-containing protein [Chloroflexi bacterium]|nr:DUF1385 domain-containing protein [Chloroflexota bacterium]MDA1270388.1 DUF1385 domain-containing protein [Chloroflexota bacterium]